MNHTVDTAEVNESTEACKGLNLTNKSLTNFSRLPELSLSLFLLSAVNSLDRTNSSLLAAFINFDDLELNLLLVELLKISAS